METKDKIAEPITLNAFRPSGNCVNLRLEPSKAVKVTVPKEGSKYLATFTISSTDCLWISNSDTLVLPYNAVPNNTSFAINANDSNKEFVFKPGTELSLITSSANMEVSIMFFKQN